MFGFEVRDSQDGVFEAKIYPFAFIDLDFVPCKNSSQCCRETALCAGGWKLGVNA